MNQTVDSPTFAGTYACTTYWCTMYTLAGISKFCPKIMGPYFHVNYSQGNMDISRECVRTGAVGARTRRPLGHHLLHPQILTDQISENSSM